MKIPDEAVEAAAKALYERRAEAVMKQFVPWEALSDATQAGFCDDVRAALEAAEVATCRPIAEADRKGPILAWAGEDGWITLWPSDDPVVIAGETLEWRDPSGALWVPRYFRPSPSPPATEKERADG